MFEVREFFWYFKSSFFFSIIAGYYLFGFRKLIVDFRKIICLFGFKVWFCVLLVLGRLDGVGDGLFVID